MSAPTPSSSHCHHDEQILAHALETRDGTEMIGLYPCWKADEDNETQNNLSELYAHWSVRQIRGDATWPRSYRRESRSAIERLFVGHDLSIISSIRIDLKDPSMTFVIPLASVAYQGRAGKGQSWLTDLIEDDQTPPFFRISPTTSANIHVSAQSTGALQVQAAGNVLGALREISSLVNPGAALITTLNREQLQQTSRALDSALSSIWSDSKGETQSSSRQLSEWYAGAHFLIQLELPDFVKRTFPPGSKPGTGQERLTRWYELTLSCARYSIFATQTYCGSGQGKRVDLTDPMALSTALTAQVSAQQVIDFKVASGKTLQQFLADHDWYARFLRLGDVSSGNGKQDDKPVAAPTQERAEAQPAAAAAAADIGTATAAGTGAVPNPAIPAAPSYNKEGQGQRSVADYAAFCNSVVTSLYSIGLSRLDSQIGLWAVVTGSPDFVGIESYFESNSRCPQLLPFAGSKGGWKFAIAPLERNAPGDGKTRSRKRRS